MHLLQLSLYTEYSEIHLLWTDDVPGKTVPINKSNFRIINYCYGIMSFVNSSTVHSLITPKTGFRSNKIYFIQAVVSYFLFCSASLSVTLATK